MISSKLAILTALMAATSMAAVPALAEDVDIDSNSIGQSITQSNEACTNTLTATEDGPGDQEVDAAQSNNCSVFQSNFAAQQATIEDESED
jgi:hypothetical protein